MEGHALAACRGKGGGPETTVKIKMDWDKRGGESCILAGSSTALQASAAPQDWLRPA